MVKPKNLNLDHPFQMIKNACETVFQGVCHIFGKNSPAQKDQKGNFEEGFF